jgi:hypothetical protein
MANSLADVHDPLSSLPAELRQLIVARLDPKSRARLAQTSRRMRDTVEATSEQYLKAFERRTKYYVSQQHLDEQLELIGVEPTQWNRERFLDALFWLNFETDIDGLYITVTPRTRPGWPRRTEYSFGTRQYVVYDDKSEEFKHNGKLHRVDGLPANIEWYDDFTPKVERHYRNGLLHRDDDLPAVIEWYPIGVIRSKTYYIDGKLHRDGDRPAMEEWYNNGQLERRHWYVNNLLHRNGDRPATEEWNRQGELTEQLWCENGVVLRVM